MTEIGSSDMETSLSWWSRAMDMSFSGSSTRSNTDRSSAVWFLVDYETSVKPIGSSFSKTSSKFIGLEFVILLKQGVVSFSNGDSAISE